MHRVQTAESVRKESGYLINKANTWEKFSECLQKLLCWLVMLSVFAMSEALPGCSQPALLQLWGLGCWLKPRISRAEQGYAVGTCAISVFLGRGNDFAFCQSHLQTVHLHGFCQLVQLRASSRGCVFRVAFVLSTPLPAKGDEDHRGEWHVGAWWVRSISTGSPCLIVCLCGESLRRCVDWERRLKKKRVRWRLKAQRLSTTFRHIKALLLPQCRSINKSFSSSVMENLPFQ